MMLQYPTHTARYMMCRFAWRWFCLRYNFHIKCFSEIDLIDWDISLYKPDLKSYYNLYEYTERAEYCIQMKNDKYQQSGFA